MSEVTLDWEAVARAAMHPIAIRTLEIITEDIENAVPYSPKWLAEQLNKPLGVVSYHVRMLADRGLIVLDHVEPSRGALKHCYRASGAVIA